MVVPLKLTQFYGSSVPRPRIYAAVKLSDHRVDPPLSVNDALLSWAADAHWSMGGLSFKRLRAQGKVEGSVRRLRAFLEEDEDASDVAGKVKAVNKGTASKPAESAGKEKPTPVKGKPIERKRQRSEEESAEATLPRKSRKRMLGETVDEDLPAFVPATEEKLQKRLGTEPAEVVSSSMRKKGLRLPYEAEILKEESLSSDAARGEKPRGELFSSSGTTLRGSKASAARGKHDMDSSPASEGGQLTRSGIKRTVREYPSMLQSSKGRPRVRKILLRASDNDSSESDDGLEAFLVEKGRPLRRSSRLVKE